VLGWHPDSPAARAAPRLLGLALEAYQEAAARNPAYLEWQADHPHLGAHQLTPA
jgi:hypothetical protein